MAKKKFHPHGAIEICISLCNWFSQQQQHKHFPALIIYPYTFVGGTGRKLSKRASVKQHKSWLINFFSPRPKNP